MDKTGDSENILILAGEASGDIHGAALIHEIKKYNQNILLSGLGGDRMIEEGFDAKYHIKDMAFLGFMEVIKHLPFIRKVQSAIIDEVKAKKIKKAVLIDYPGFNLNTARKLKKLDVTIFYYITPQIWAWGKRRIAKIKKYIDKMIVVFPFEENFYKEHDVDVEYVGHPLVQRIYNYNFDNKEDFYRKFDLDLSKEILLLMPGSRKHEIYKILPECMKAAVKLADEFDYQIVIACPDNINESIFDEYKDVNFKVIKNQSYNLFKLAKFGIIKSGTSTMEAAIIGLPFIVVYATSWLTYLIGSKLVKLSNIAMPNIISGKEIVKEFIQKEMNSESIYSYVKSIINNKDKIENLKGELLVVKQKLGNKSASELAAKIICA